MNNQPNHPNQAPRQTNWRFVLIALLIGSLIGLGVFAYHYFQIREDLLNQTQQVENLLEHIDRLEERVEDLKTTEFTDETADWQIYRNEEYGFEIRYPSKYRVHDYTGKIIDRSPTVKEYSNPVANFIKEGQGDITAYIEYWETEEGHLNFHKSEPDFITEVNKGGYIVIDYSPGINYPVPTELREEWEMILSTFKFID